MMAGSIAAGFGEVALTNATCRIEFVGTQVFSAMTPLEQFLCGHAIATLIIVFVANWIRTILARESAKHRFVGWWAFALLVGGFFVSGIMLYSIDPYPFASSIAMWFGLFGLISGNLIGHWLWKDEPKGIDTEDDV